MKSIYDELSGRILKDPSLIRRSGPRQDLGLLLFNQREDIKALWLAAEDCARALGPACPEELLKAVERLKPLFGERA